MGLKHLDVRMISETLRQVQALIHTRKVQGVLLVAIGVVVLLYFDMVGGVGIDSLLVGPANPDTLAAVRISARRSEAALSTALAMQAQSSVTMLAGTIVGLGLGITGGAYMAYSRQKQAIQRGRS